MTEDEEDIWELDLDFGGIETDENDGLDADMTIGELMEWRYFKAEKAKELVRFSL
jgi:RNA polymerase II-associated protein 3